MGQAGLWKVSHYFEMASVFTSGMQFGKHILTWQYFMHLYFYFSERVTIDGVLYDMITHGKIFNCGSLKLLLKQWYKQSKRSHWESTANADD